MKITLKPTKKSSREVGILKKIKAHNYLKTYKEIKQRSWNLETIKAHNYLFVACTNYDYQLNRPQRLSSVTQTSHLCTKVDKLMDCALPSNYTRELH